MRRTLSVLVLLLALAAPTAHADAPAEEPAPAAEGAAGFDAVVNAAVEPAANWLAGWVFWSLPITTTFEVPAGKPMPASAAVTQRLGLDNPVQLGKFFGEAGKDGAYGGSNASVDGKNVGPSALVQPGQRIRMVRASLPLIVVWLIVGGLFFTVYLGFLPFRAFGTAIDMVRGRYDDPDDPGEVSHFQALATALSGTVGLGNIAGVAVAVSVGGPGATFWMILAGVLGMSAKLAECTLAVKYRRVDKDGSVSGGPMHYLELGLAELGHNWGRYLGIAYAITMLFACFGGGNMFQSNQAFEMLVSATGGEGSWFADKGWLVGLVLAVAVGVVIVGGIKGIAKVTDKLVPAMAVLYVLTALVVILMNIGAVPGAIAAIVTGAFAPKALAGGAIGAMIQGFKRAAFSNEAGLGSAAIAHSAVKTKEPATEGFVALLEPFIDTIVICTLTSLVIVTTVYSPSEAEAGINLTARAFDSGISGASKVMALAAFLFAFSTAISWSYYGVKAWTYLVGDSDAMVKGFQLVFCVFTALGAMVSLEAVILISDSMIFVLALFNLFGMYFLAPVVKREIDGYLGRLASGEIKKHF